MNIYTCCEIMTLHTRLASIKSNSGLVSFPLGESLILARIQLIAVVSLMVEKAIVWAKQLWVITSVHSKLDGYV